MTCMTLNFHIVSNKLSLATHCVLITESRLKEGCTGSKQRRISPIRHTNDCHVMELSHLDSNVYIVTDCPAYWT